MDEVGRKRLHDLTETPPRKEFKIDFGIERDAHCEKTGMIGRHNQSFMARTLKFLRCGLKGTDYPVDLRLSRIGNNKNFQTCYSSMAASPLQG